jgi:hypothetical protein
LNPGQTPSGIDLPPTPPDSPLLFGSPGRASRHNPDGSRISAEPVASGQTPTKFPPLPSRPYRPIQLQSYPGYGVQGKAAVSCTDYARQAAEMLIDDEGRLDTAHISQIVKDLHDGSNLPRHHRAHLIRTLEQLQKNPELASTINSVCEDKPLRGPAADLVRATLNLPFDHAAPAKGEARKALVMSLLGDLRQREVGSCFATAPAICLLDSSPEIVAGYMKGLLEDNKLTVRTEGVEAEVPLNQRISRAQAQVALNVWADGLCDGETAGVPTVTPYKLHETPGMQGALVALGIAPQDMEHAVMYALGKIGASPNKQYSVSCEQILKQLARHCPDHKKGFSFAINAFEGKEDVRLLRAWEYTLASTDEIPLNSTNVGNIAGATLFGSEIAGKPDPQSLSSKDFEYRCQLASDPRLASAALQDISVMQFNDIQVLMQQRFCLLYDADVKQGMTPANGESIRGGFTLYNRTPAGDPSRWQRIDNPEKFQAAIAKLVADASFVTGENLSLMPGDLKTNSEVLKKTTRKLTENIWESSFIEHIVDNASQTPNGKLLPWQQRRGADGDFLLNNLGGKVMRFANDETSRSPTAAANAGGPTKPGDATHVIEFFCDALKQMEPALRDKASRTHPDFRVPVSVATHAFSLMPMAFKEAWLDGGDPQQWIHDKLKKPVLDHLHAQRTEPPLFTLLQSIGTQLGANQPQMNYIYQQIASQGAMRRDGQSYTLSRVRQELETYCTSQPDGADLRGRGEDLLAEMVPAPAVPFADTNWSSEAGGAILVEASYNPFKGRVETHFVDDDGSRLPLFQTWLDGPWTLSTPLTPAA